MLQDRRKELAKGVAKFGEESKVAVRNVRKDVMKKIDKYGDAFSKVCGLCYLADTNRMHERV